MPFNAASSCRDLFNRHMLYMVFKIWLETSRKWGRLIVDLNKSVSTSIAFEF